MCWYHYLSYFFGGAFLANALPLVLSLMLARAFGRFHGGL